MEGHSVARGVTPTCNYVALTSRRTQTKATLSSQQRTCETEIAGWMLTGKQLIDFRRRRLMVTIFLEMLASWLYVVYPLPECVLKWVS
jgi:hypothetical protein